MESGEVEMDIIVLYKGFVKAMREVRRYSMFNYHY